MEESENIECLLELPLEDAVREKLQSSRKLNIVVVGCYQVGKSTLINAMFFQEGKAYVEHAEEGSMRPCTQEVRPHILRIKDGEVEVDIKIFDSPGLQDGDNDDRQYLRMIKDECSEVHLIIYCTKMGEPIRSAEEVALKNITSIFGEVIWKNVVVALTFANQVEPASPMADEDKHFMQCLTTKKEVLKECFEKLGYEPIFEELATRIYPVGSARKPHLPTIKNWQGEFWRGCLDACEPEGKGALLKLAWRNKHFLKLVGASVGTTGGGISMVAGVGCVVAGSVLSATGFLAPLGVPLIAAGVVAGILGMGATFGGATGIRAARNKQNK